MKYCDLNDSILEWGSEEVVIPYRSPLDNRIHRYFVDFYIKVEDMSGQIKKYLIEVKPKNKPNPQQNQRDKLKDISVKSLSMQRIKLNGKCN